MFNIFEYSIASAIVAQPIPSLVLGVPAQAQSAKMVKHPGSRKLKKVTVLLRRQMANDSTDTDSGVSSTETIVDSEDRKKKQAEQEKRKTKRETEKKAKQEKRQAKRAIEMKELLARSLTPI